MTGQKLRSILYIDDDRYLQDLVRIVLNSMANLNVHTCDSGRDAVAIASNFRPDLILLDAAMPEMDGPATLSELRKLPCVRNTPVVFLTNQAQDRDIAYYRSLGAAGVIAKPFESLDLPEQVLQLWEAMH